MAEKTWAWQLVVGEGVVTVPREGEREGECAKTETEREKEVEWRLLSNARTILALEASRLKAPLEAPQPLQTGTNSRTNKQGLS